MIQIFLIKAFLEVTQAVMEAVDFQGPVVRIIKVGQML
jgi:hypothetical protein